MNRLIRKGCVAIFNCSDDGCDYKVVKPSTVKETDVLVLCSHPECDKPAKLIDHLFPYHQEMNRCEDHLPALYKELPELKCQPKKRAAARFSCPGYPPIPDVPDHNRKLK